MVPMVAQGVSWNIFSHDDGFMQHKHIRLCSLPPLPIPHGVVAEIRQVPLFALRPPCASALEVVSYAGWHGRHRLRVGGY
jgi:hypothetical protein